VCVCLFVCVICVCVCLFVCVTCVYVKLYAPYIIECVHEGTRVWPRACQICVLVRMSARVFVRVWLYVCVNMCAPYVYTYICMSIYPSVCT